MTKELMQLTLAFRSLSDDEDVDNVEIDVPEEEELDEDDDLLDDDDDDADEPMDDGTGEQ